MYDQTWAENHEENHAWAEDHAHPTIRFTRNEEDHAQTTIRFTRDEVAYAIEMGSPWTATKDELAEAERAYWEAEAEGRLAIDIEERIWALEAALDSTKSDPPPQVHDHDDSFQPIHCDSCFAIHTGSPMSLTGWAPSHEVGVYDPDICEICWLATK